MGCLGKKPFKRNLKRVGANYPVRRNRKCKGPEATACLIYSMSDKEIGVRSKNDEWRVEGTDCEKSCRLLWTLALLPGNLQNH